MENVNRQLLKVTPPRTLFGRHSGYQPEFPTFLFKKEEINNKKVERNVFRRSSPFQPEFPSSIFYEETINELSDNFYTITPSKAVNADGQAFNLSSIPLPPSSSILTKSISKSKDMKKNNESMENYDK